MSDKLKQSLLVFLITIIVTMTVTSVHAAAVYWDEHNSAHLTSESGLTSWTCG